MNDIAVAFPVAEAQRALLRSMAPDTPLPALYENGAKNLPCAECGMTLNVGPRLQATGLPIYCLICATHMAKQTRTQIDVQHLGNPESKTEPRIG
jgi:hypothetical protein